MSESYYWSEVEDERLRQLYATDLPVAEIAVRVGRSANACRQRARVLDLYRPDRSWTGADDTVLRDGWGRTRTRELARRLGRTARAVRLRAGKLGLVSGRIFSRKEKALVRELYPAHTAEQVAEAVWGDRRKTKRVWNIARQLGLSKYPRLTDEEIDAVSDANAEGLCDRLAAERTGLTADQCKHIRQRFGWPFYPDVGAKRRAVENQRKTLGIRHGGDLRRLAYRRFATRNGWPEDLRPREVQILNALAARGVPMTKAELCAAIGVSARPTFRSGKRKILLSGNGHGGTYTASLAHRGLIIRMVRAGTVTGRGSGRSVDLYCLSPEALAILQRRAEEQKCETVTTP